jgi:uncharacterized protein
MNCPRCESVNLVITYREGIEIDHCPQCRGVWLDRGELDKMIEKSLDALPGQTVDNEDNARSYKKKQKGFLTNLFVID